MLICLLFLHENICCGYSLEAPRRGASNEYPQHMFSWRNKKNIVWIPPLICSYVIRIIFSNIKKLGIFGYWKCALWLFWSDWAKAGQTPKESFLVLQLKYIWTMSIKKNPKWYIYVTIILLLSRVDVFCLTRLFYFSLANFPFHHT